MNLGKNPESVGRLDERDASVNYKSSNRSGLNILGKFSYQLLSAISGNLILQVTRWCACPIKFRCVL